ncbi:hypothetical protein AVEN_105052-1 [Araneus ventricosus]|uniref:CCHC-type domain-containing protein n=1 Tax=Araneus ventricosus TaxID=182803 RepID=A0A4Y2RL01_ARAVE|nr:hypothetical protein AVEN_105052-1 [Araneus ventricosus]
MPLQTQVTNKDSPHHIQEPTFASMLKRNLKQTPQKPKNPTILVYRKGTSQNNTDHTTPEKKNLEVILRKELSCKEITIKNVKPVRNDGIAITCGEEKDIKALLEKIEKTKSLKENVTARPPAKRHSSIIIYGIPNSTPLEDIQEALKSNANIENSLRLRFKIRGRQPDTSHWVFEAPAEDFYHLKSIRKIAINWKMHGIQEFYHIKKCLRCQDFGHVVSECKCTKPFCGFCGNRHETHQCRANLPPIKL